MSSEHDPEPDLRQALDHAASPRARGEFQAQLRARFLTTALPARTPSAFIAQSGAERREPASAEPVRDGSVRSEPRERRPWLTLVSLAAIAAVVLIIYRWPGQTGWRVAPSSDFLVARVDGTEYQLGDSARMAAAIGPGSFIEVEGGSLELVLDRRLAFSLASGAAVTLVSIPEPDVLAELLLEQSRGSLALLTGPEFAGSSLRIQTPDADVRVTGTEFSIDVISGAGTCVCCESGSVLLASDVKPTDPAAEIAEPQTIGGGSRGFAPADGRPLQSGSAENDHLAPIQVLRQVWGTAR